MQGRIILLTDATHLKGTYTHTDLPEVRLICEAQPKVKLIGEVLRRTDKEEPDYLRVCQLAWIDKLFGENYEALCIRKIRLDKETNQKYVTWRNLKFIVID